MATLLEDSEQSYVSATCVSNYVRGKAGGQHRLQGVPRLQRTSPELFMCIYEKQYYLPCQSDDMMIMSVCKNAIVTALFVLLQHQKCAKLT